MILKHAVYIGLDAGIVNHCNIPASKVMLIGVTICGMIGLQRTLSLKLVSKIYLREYTQ